MYTKSSTKELKLELDESINEVIDEVPGSAFIALRKLRWTPSAPFKLDIRKWYTNSEGEEIAGKGVAFMTEEGPDNLISALIHHGYGDTRKTLNQLKDRDDFIPAIAEIIKRDNIDIDSVDISESISENEEYYDPKAIIA